MPYCLLRSIDARIFALGRTQFCFISILKSHVDTLHFLLTGNYGVVGGFVKEAKYSWKSG